MNKENMLKWADALESGKYKQCNDGWGSLNGDEGLCCLNVAFVEFTGQEYNPHQSGLGAYRKGLNDIFDFPSIAPVDFLTTAEKTKLSSHGYNDGDVSITTRFMQCNDTLGLSFDDIAAKIRKLVDAN